MRHPLSLVHIAAPEGWQDASVYSFVAPENGGLRANVLVTQEAVDDTDVRAFAERQGTELAQALPGYQRLSSEATKVGVLEGVRVEYTFIASVDDLVRQNVVYVMLGDIAYTLVMTCEDRGTASLRGLFDQVIASFKIG